MFADLHLHSCFSDGTWSPERLVEEALVHGFKALALTDHDTLEGCAEMSEACSKHGVAFVTGVEMTTDLEGEELHILGYFVDPRNESLLSQLTKFQAARQQRIKEIVTRLNELGISLQPEAVAGSANCRSPGRPHVARALVQQGFCASHDEAFERFLKKHRPAWVPKWKVSAREGIRLVHQAGGLAVLAHPGLSRADRFIPSLVDEGIDGLECFHPKHPPGAVAHYIATARAHRLLITGGSDCHGLNKGKAMIGTVRLPYEYYLSLADSAKKPKPAEQAPGSAANNGHSQVSHTAIAS